MMVMVMVMTFWIILELTKLGGYDLHVLQSFIL